MRKILLFLAIAILAGCDSGTESLSKRIDIIFLHHSTGNLIWIGNTNKYVYKVFNNGEVESYIKKYNRQNNSNFRITDRDFPARSPYGWKNYPYDYYNIWVKHAGEETYLEEPTLEILTKEYDIIIFKHCFPVSNIQEDTGIPEINSEEKRLENYKLQYNALKEKLHEFQNNKFIVWTPTVHEQNSITVEEAKRTKEFYFWIMNEWSEKDDNIFLWDFYNYQTEGDLFFKEEYSSGPNNSHPNAEFAGRMAPLFAQYIIDVAEGRIP